MTNGWHELTLLSRPLFVRDSMRSKEFIDAWKRVVKRIEARRNDYPRFASLLDSQHNAIAWDGSLVALVAQVEDVADLEARLKDGLGGMDPCVTMSKLLSKEVGTAARFTIWPRSRLIELSGCNHPSGYVVMERHRIANGSIQVRERCTICQKNPHGHGVSIPHVEVSDLHALPLASDATVDGLYVCRVCGAPAVEMHHWAPRALFGSEADDWPMDPLCPDHHARWHAVVTPAGLHKTVVEVAK